MTRVFIDPLAEKLRKQKIRVKIIGWGLLIGGFIVGLIALII